MPDYKNIIWLASYPKSGNTWFRVFLSNLLSEDQEPADINNLHETPIASARQPFDEATGLPSADLTFEEVDHLRPEVYRFQAKQANSLQYRKVHDAYTYLENGSPLFPTDISRGVIYFIRNPLDVLISFAHHSAKAPADMVEVLNDPEKAFGRSPKKQFNQLRQKLSTWSDHVKSWVDQENTPVHLMCYEDMRRSPKKTFLQAVNFLHLEVGEKDVEEALNKSDLTVLKDQEQNNGFKEKMIKADSFFRKGQVGEWKEVLTEEQVQKIIDQHSEVMKRFGYL